MFVSPESQPKPQLKNRTGDSGRNMRANKAIDLEATTTQGDSHICWLISKRISDVET